MLRTKSRQFDLESLVPENSIDEAIRISSLGDWSKKEKVGQGTYGNVWRYATPIKETPVAAGKHLIVKLFDLNEKEKTDLKAREDKFIAELNTLRKIPSAFREYFVHLIGYYLGCEELVIFTEYMENGSIKGQILDNPLDEVTALKYIFQTTHGVHFLHNLPVARIVHLDIKYSQK
uniref:non-specific serine/threonine protein kinase n=1 Tax=Plectus sambesii TaxID=2011161 RepID=A0A914WS69_9BILA